MSDELKASDFDNGFKLKAVCAYRIVSEISDPYLATAEDMDAGFERLLSQKWFRPMAVQHLEELEPTP